MIDTRDENVEIELKILVQDEEAFTRYLEEHTTFIKEEMIEDTYFENPDYPFLYIDEKGLKNAKKRLRVRKSNSGDTINFKEKVFGEKEQFLYSNEIEEKLTSGEQMIKILESLGFVTSCHYHKTRKVYHTENFEFDVDLIDVLGMVVEIEYQGKLDDLKNGIDMIRNFLKEIHITNYIEVRTTYPEILWNGMDCYL
ncbi:MAG: class IV adenylate cyclase [Bacilli bacterium]|nr:class IV adenylate cyclase [Bacilli bacterium]